MTITGLRLRAGEGADFSHARLGSLVLPGLRLNDAPSCVLLGASGSEHEHDVRVGFMETDIR